ncbi:MAG: hypothetical protein ACRC26_06550 [Bacteroidales bacterium]
MENIIKKGSYPVRPNKKANNQEVSTIDLPKIEGDIKICLGQTIVTLIRIAIENNQCYSKKVQHYFKVELMTSILEELNISTSEIEEVYRNRHECGEIEQSEE